MALRLRMDLLERSRDREVAQRLERVPTGSFTAIVEPRAHDKGKQRVHQRGDDRGRAGTVVLELRFEEVDDRAYPVSAGSIDGNS